MMVFTPYITIDNIFLECSQITLTNTQDIQGDF